MTPTQNTANIPAANLPRAARPDLYDKPITLVQRILVGVFVIVPTAFLVAAVPLAWG
jgi:hypothetical protein